MNKTDKKYIKEMAEAIYDRVPFIYENPSCNGWFPETQYKIEFNSKFEGAKEKRNAAYADAKVAYETIKHIVNPK